MGDVYRITDRFQTEGSGIVYRVDTGKGTAVHIGDILFDLRGNRLRVKGIEMTGIVFELLDGNDASGSIFVRDLQNINFLFCNHPLYQHRVDEDYEGEYQAAKMDHACALFSYEDMQMGKLSLYGEDISGLTVYRGWMMTPEMYRDFYEALVKRGIFLINTPEEYNKYHLLPGWYGDFETETAKSVWSTTDKKEDAMALTKEMDGAFIVKDYVKSRKHEWYDACFIKNIQDTENASKVIGNFIDRQADSLVGGVVLRHFETLRQIGFHGDSGMPLSEEYRVFVYAGQILAIDDYWTDKKEVNLTKDEYSWVESIAKRIKSNFVTVDLARKEDGSLIIMEFGDGQVSGLQHLKEENFYRTFKGQNVGRCKNSI